MAYNHQVTTKTDGLYVALGNNTDGYRLAGLKDIGELAMTGTASQIDTTGYLGTNKTYSQGKLDPGQISATANAAPHSPLYTWLEDAQKEATEHTFSVVMGAITDTGLTEGGARSVVSGVTVSTASGGPVTIGVNASQNMPGISLGDYATPYDAAGSLTKTAREITAIAEVKTGSDKGKVNLTLESGTPSLASTMDRVDIVRPAVLLQIQVLVMKVSYRFPVDGVAEATIELQATGEGTRTVGDPNISMTTGAGNNPYNIPLK